ncbi:MAG: DUF4115 domain-containing protein [Elusimicrobia bacterium]|nr:DUF4115 domain-containing protein [Elusimicrobiota bacterium]
MDIGSKFKEQREKLGLSLEEISAKTLINVKYLKAIEENRFADIPTEVMKLGFFSNYSNTLGLNTDEIIAEYKKNNPSKEQTSITSVKVNCASHSRRFKFKVAPAFILVFSLVFIYGFFKIIYPLLKSEKTETVEQQAVKKNQLEIRTSENVWIRVRDGENPVFEGIMPPNTVKIFESSERFSLRIGNMVGIAVFFNGAPVELSKDKLIGEIKLP